MASYTMNDSSCNQSEVISDEEYHDHIDSAPGSIASEPRASAAAVGSVPQQQLPQQQLPPASSVTSQQQQQQQMSVTIESGGHTRILSLPVQALQQREQEMNQTALLLDIPPERWSGSRLYRLWKQHQENSVVAIPLLKITLHEPPSLVAQHWAARRETLDWIHNYYLTGKLQIPDTARGYDILAAVEYFEILYQPDQCHFSSLEVYKRVQQWSRYLCHRAALAAWVVQTASKRKLSTQKIAFGTSTVEDGSMELGTRVLPCLGDWEPITPDSKKSLAQIAFCLLNSRPQQSPSTAHSQHDDNSTIFTAQEEGTAAEIRHDFAVYVQEALQRRATVKCTVKPVTVRTEDCTSSSSHDSNTKSSSFNKQDSQSFNKQDSQTKESCSRLQIVNRAVLVIDWSNSSNALDLSTDEITRSDLSAPVDEYVEEDLAKGRLEELVHKVDARNSPEKGSPTSVVQQPKKDLMSDRILESRRKPRNCGNVTWKDEGSPTNKSNFVEPKKLEFDVDSPDDERIADAVPAMTHPYKFRKKKKKAVFEFQLAPENSEEMMMIPEAQPVVKSPAGLHPKGCGGAPPASSIAIVRSSTYDNTVTSALTGPYYVDEKGQLRDVFEQPANDGWDDENTRAQARRHDWIQTALMNRGIDERVEALLNAEDTGATGSEHFRDGEDAWDWLTGLKICEFSRSVVDSVERKFAIGSACRDGDGTAACPPCDVFTTKRDDVSPSREGPKSDNHCSPKSASDPPYNKSRLDVKAEPESKLEDLPQAGNDISSNPSEEDQSQDSPRGVDCTFGLVVATDNRKPEAADNTAGEADGGAETETPSPETSPGGRKRGRGIKSLLFRRRK